MQRGTLRWMLGVVSVLCWVIGVGSGECRAQETEGRLTPEEFIILPWGWTPGQEELLRDIKDCGFNLAGFVAPEHVDLVEKIGLECIVSDPGISSAVHSGVDDPTVIQKEVERVTTLLAGNPAVFGYYLRDEPNSSMFPMLAAWHNALKKADPKTTPYINLFPNYASAGQLGNNTYPEHLEAYIKAVGASYVSYDHYALMDDGSLRDGYFQNLEAARDLALRHNIRFWNIVLGNAHFRYAEPTPGGLRFQVYTTLAYGGRGISYFTYFTPTRGNYRLAPLDQFHHKTPTWDMIRQVNLQIHKLGPTYVQLESVNVFHHPEVPEGCRGLETSRYLNTLSGGNFLVGEFKGPEERCYVMVVNKDFHTSAAFSIGFKEAGQIFTTNAYTGDTYPWGGESGWLAPGQGMLLSLRK